MTFYSHSKKTSKGEVIGEKTLKEHITGILEIVDQGAFKDLPFGWGAGSDDFDYLMRKVVLFHDFGKFTSYFQNYLLARGNVDYELKQHARVGGLMAYNFLKEKNPRQALIALYVIFRHHANLDDLLTFPTVFNDRLLRIFEEQCKDLKSRLPEIEANLEIADLSKWMKYPDERDLRRGYKLWIKKESNVSDYFLVNYLFSLLVEADKLDASRTPWYQPKPIEPGCVDHRFGLPEFRNKQELKGLNHDELRNFCRAQVVSVLESEQILHQHIFTLTAPTGIGKTMTALDFALKLKSLIKEKQGVEARIIYALPFINIIEQALDEYKMTLPTEVVILGHYQYADVFGKDKETSDGAEAAEGYNKKRMMLDTWQSDVVITSFVQFFETLIGYRNKLLLKFNHLAHSIVILDEVQTLRLDQMPLIGATLYYMAKYLKTRVVLMTATRPKIFELAQEEILNREGEEVKPLELLSSFEEIFALFKRTRIVPLLENKEVTGEDGVSYFVNSVFAHRWTQGKSCVLVCNTVNRSIELFDALKDYFEENGIQNPLQYLSTNIIPLQRHERIKTLRQQLLLGQAPVLVSTQVVEAGVDLDFDMGFRDIGPIDSIIQVAGRINRNNHPDKMHAPLYVMDFGDGQKIYGQITIAQARKALSLKSEFPEEDYLELINGYFDNISSRSSFSRYNKIFDSIKHLRYQSEDIENDRPVSIFRIIEDKHHQSVVFVERDERACILRQKYMEKVSGKISKQDFDGEYKLLFQQHIITVPDYLTKDLSPINEIDDSLQVIEREIVDDYYRENTGFIRKQTDAVVML